MPSEKLYQNGTGIHNRYTGMFHQITEKLILWATTALSAPQVIQWDTNPNHRKFEDALSDASNAFSDVSDVYFDYNSNYAQMLRLVSFLGMTSCDLRLADSGRKHQFQNLFKISTARIL